MSDAAPVTVADLLLHQARVDPSGLAFAERGRRSTFGDLAERATDLAGALQRRGVRSGDRVGIAMPAGLGLVETFWALQLAGAACCVVNPSTPSATLARRLERLRPRLVITEDVADELVRERAPLHERDVGPDDVAFLQLTSGTSGEARASMITQRNVISYLRTSRTTGFLGREDVFVCWAPPWHDLGLVRFVLGAVQLGACCHLVEPAVRTIPEWLTTISEVGGTYSAAPDFALRLAVKMVEPGTVDLSSLRFMKSGGEPVRKSTIDDFEDRFDALGVVVPGYGLGEATLGVSEHLPGDEIAVDQRGNVSCGPANAGLEVRAGRTLDEPAEILVRGETVFSGYFDASDETSRTLRDGWLHTGDAGYFDEHERLFILGRREGMIKRAGSVVAPRELEEAAQRVEQVRVAAAVSTTSGGREVIVVAVEAEPSDDEGSTEQIAAAVSREVLAATGFAPGRVTVLPRRTIPRTSNGKVRHAATRDLLEREFG